MRDVQSLWWAAGGRPHAARARTSTISTECYDVLLARPGGAAPRDRVAPATCCGSRTRTRAAAAGWRTDADVFMADIAAAGADRCLARRRGTGGASAAPPAASRRRSRPASCCVDGEIELSADADPGQGPDVGAARPRSRPHDRGARIGRPTASTASTAEVAGVARSRGRSARSTSWSALLLEGHRAIPVLESLDQRGLVSRMLPEWEPVRSQAAAQRVPPLHRRPAPLGGGRERVPSSSTWSRDPTCSCSARLFHDLGKGYPGDHTDVGMELVALDRARSSASPSADVEILVTARPAPPAAARRGDAPRPVRSGHDPPRSPTRWRRSTCSTCSTR